MTFQAFTVRHFTNRMAYYTDNPYLLTIYALPSTISTPRALAILNWYRKRVQEGLTLYQIGVCGLPIERDDGFPYVP